jgi:hypothetical protein
VSDQVIGSSFHLLQLHDLVYACLYVCICMYYMGMYAYYVFVHVCMHMCLFMCMCVSVDVHMRVVRIAFMLLNYEINYV